MNWLLLWRWPWPPHRLPDAQCLGGGWPWPPSCDRTSCVPPWSIWGSLLVPGSLCLSSVAVWLGDQCLQLSDPARQPVLLMWDGRVCLSGPCKLPARLGSYMHFLGLEVVCVPTLPWPSSLSCCVMRSPPALACCIIVSVSCLWAVKLSAHSVLKLCTWTCGSANAVYRFPKLFVMVNVFCNSNDVVDLQSFIYFVPVYL